MQIPRIAIMKPVPIGPAADSFNSDPARRA
jgi:hypothetical protein